MFLVSVGSPEEGTVRSEVDGAAGAMACVFLCCVVAGLGMCACVRTCSPCRYFAVPRRTVCVCADGVPARTEPCSSTLGLLWTWTWRQFAAVSLLSCYCRRWQCPLPVSEAQDREHTETQDPGGDGKGKPPDADAAERRRRKARAEARNKSEESKSDSNCN